MYYETFNKQLAASTLSKWVKTGRLKVTILPQEQRLGSQLYDYDLDSFKEIINSDDYIKRVRATKQNPKDYIGKQCGYLKIEGVVPKEEKKEPNYLGTLMYCKCLKCQRPDLIQVRFTYLTGSGGYKQVSCGCDRKVQAFLATIKQNIDESFISQFSNVEKFLYIHKMLNSSVTNGYYTTCSIEEYKQAIIYFYNNENFNLIYDFWINNQNKTNTFYDWAKPSIDHIIPKSKGGTNQLKNLQILTVFENLAKRDLTQEEWEQFKKETNTSSDYFIENIKKRVREGEVVTNVKI